MRRNRANKIWVLLALVVLLASCRNKRPSDVLPPEKLEAVLYDYHLVQVMVSDMPTNERYKKDLYFDYIYDKHEVTKADIDSSLVYYARYPKDLSEIYVRLSERIERDIQRIEEAEVPLVKREAVPVEGDSVDLWYDVSIIQLMVSPLTNRYSFMVPVDTNFKVGDRIEWGGKALFLNTITDSLRNYLYLNLTVTYDNDSLMVADTLMYATGNYSLVVADTSDVLVKSIKGSAYLKGQESADCVLLAHPYLLRERKQD